MLASSGTSWRPLERLSCALTPKHRPQGGSRDEKLTPDTEVDHGETVSVQDPYRQPHAPSRNADAELRVRSAIVGRRRQAARLPDVHLRLQDRGGRTGLLRLRIWPARAPRGNGRRLGLFAVQPPEQRDRRGQAFRLRTHRQVRAVFVRHVSDSDHHPRVRTPGRRDPALPAALWRDRDPLRQDACGSVHRRGRLRGRRRRSRGQRWQRKTP